MVRYKQKNSTPYFEAIKTLDGYTTDTTKLRFHHGPASFSIASNTEQALETFRHGDIHLDETEEETSTGAYSRLIVTFVFHRKFRFYLIQIYVPISLVVVTSWTAFWIHRESAPARVMLGILTVLTITNFITGINASMPKVSYIKAVDFYLSFSYLMVVAALVEYGVVGFVAQRKKDAEAARQRSLSVAADNAAATGADLRSSLTVHKRTQTDHLTSQPDVVPAVVANGPTNLVYRRKKTVHLADDNSDAPCTCPSHDVDTAVKQPESFAFQVRPNDINELDEDESMRLLKHSHMPAWATIQLSFKGSIVDIFARVVFPLAYTLFNVGYWIWLLTKTEQTDIFAD